MLENVSTPSPSSTKLITQPKWPKWGHDIFPPRKVGQEMPELMPVRWLDPHERRTGAVEVGRPRICRDGGMRGAVGGAPGVGQGQHALYAVGLRVEAGVDQAGPWLGVEDFVVVVVLLVGGAEVAALAS